MKRYTYVVVGGGMTADACVQGIRERDAKGSLVVLSAEKDPPYQRPPLSKKLWKGGEVSAIDCGTERHGAEVLTGRRVTALAPDERTVTDEHGESYGYERLLLATGGDPVRLPGDDGGRVVYYRTLEDYRRVRQLAGEHDEFLVIGGGFIGSEMAAALAMQDKKVTLAFPEEGVGARLFPREVALYLNGMYRERGVRVLPGTKIAGLGNAAEKVEVQTAGGQMLRVDGVVAGLGIRPSVDLAQGAGLKVEDGIVVDELLRAGRPDLFAAGDVAAFPDAVLGRRRVEHEDNAVSMGRTAGHNMAGDNEAYRHQPSFYSDMFDVGYEAVGLLDARLETVIEWAEPYAQGVLCYLRSGRPVGVLLWNVWDQVPAARDLLAAPEPPAEDKLRAWCRDRLG